MLSRESRARSGSDFDGDQRFNWIFDKSGMKHSVRMNRIMLMIVDEYQKPENFDKISMPINVSSFDDIVDEIRTNAKSAKNYNLKEINSVLSLIESRKNNLAGSTMKTL